MLQPAITQKQFFKLSSQRSHFEILYLRFVLILLKCDATASIKQKQFLGAILFCGAFVEVQHNSHPIILVSAVMRSFCFAHLHMHKNIPVKSELRTILELPFYYKSVTWLTNLENSMLLTLIWYNYNFSCLPFAPWIIG